MNEQQSQDEECQAHQPRTMAKVSYEVLLHKLDAGEASLSEVTLQLFDGRGEKIDVAWEGSGLGHHHVDKSGEKFGLLRKMRSREESQKQFLKRDMPYDFRLYKYFYRCISKKKFNAFHGSTC